MFFLTPETTRVDAGSGESMFYLLTGVTRYGPLLTFYTKGEFSFVLKDTFKLDYKTERLQTVFKMPEAQLIFEAKGDNLFEVEE